MNGEAIVHFGWFNVAIAALAIWAILRMRRAPLIAFGIAAIAFAVVTNGLLGPDAHTIVGAPGTSVHVDEVGAIAFPPLGADRSPIGGDWRITMNAFLREVPRTVVGIEVSDARGAHLTMTQPTGVAFLSPVLLMQGTQNLDGLDVPFDSFAVPAVHRIVKAVLLTGPQVASLPRLAAFGGSAVIFDLEDDSGNDLSHGIGVAGNGETVVIDGIRLRPTILTYPAVRAIAIPNLGVVAAGLLSLIVGLLLTRRPRRGKIAER